MSTGGSSRSGLKRPHDDSTKFSPDTSRHPAPSKAGHGSKHGPLHPSTKSFKSGTKPWTKTTKMASAKAADTVGVFYFGRAKLDKEGKIVKLSRLEERVDHTM